MKIFYVIVKEKGRGATAERISSQCEMISHCADTTVLKLDENTGFSPYNIIKVLKAFSTELNNSKPDIVHIYGCWNFIAACIMNIAARKKYIVAYSPYGGLHYFNRKDKNFWKVYLPKWIAFQWYMVRKPRYIIARNSKEYNQIRQYNKKSSLVIIDRELSDNEITERLQKRYQQITDENVFSFMKENEIKSFFVLLRNGVDVYVDRNKNRMQLSQEKIGRQTSREEISTIEQLEEIEIKRIFLLAEKTNVSEYISNGARLYINRNGKFEQHIKNVQANDDEFTKEYEKNDNLVDLIKTVRKNIKKKDNKAILRNIISIYLLIKYKDCDEEKLAGELDSQKLTPFTSRIEAIINELLFLEEGYMIVPATNSRKTRALKNRIFDSMK